MQFKHLLEIIDCYIGIEVGQMQLQEELLISTMTTCPEI